MKLSWNMVFQGLGSLIQGGNLLSDIVPLKYKPLVALVVGLAQSAVSWKAHQSNPDGTPAAEPYVKK